MRVDNGEEEDVILFEKIRVLILEDKNDLRLVLLELMLRFFVLGVIYFELMVRYGFIEVFVEDIV